MNNDNKINTYLLAEINSRKIRFPDFAAMSKFKMAQFIWHNSDIAKVSNLTGWAELADERTALELEIWSKEIYCKIQDSLNRCVTSNPSLTISIKAEVV